MTLIESKSAVHAMRGNRRLTRDWSGEKHSAVSVVTAVFKGQDRKPFKNGGRYNIIVQRCGGHRFHNGEWTKDTRVQIYLETYHPSRDSGHTMYDSLEEAKKDFAL